ncbi:hypothetical protein CEXT_188191 [Caerostris extrusa]|uniref:Uncharacterized protein n=1 Tax=Caerostris extrusa TaxID=172846 RepID=A0AAV4TZ72_CAEEX|nr:hypothetical protein CEXT_188191 [Caerostris extrusa]
MAHRVSKCKKPHIIIVERKLSFTVEMVNIMADVSARKLLSSDGKLLEGDSFINSFMDEVTAFFFGCFYW